MVIATLGAFYIGEYPEGVAVMLFYTVGELFQGKAVDKAKRNIGALLDVRPEKALVLREGNLVTESRKKIKVGPNIGTCSECRRTQSPGRIVYSQVCPCLHTDCYHTGRINCIISICLFTYQSCICIHI